jgi:hypothetical protein
MSAPLKLAKKCRVQRLFATRKAVVLIEAVLFESTVSEFVRVPRLMATPRAKPEEWFPNRFATELRSNRHKSSVDQRADCQQAMVV